MMADAKPADIGMKLANNMQDKKHFDLFGEVDNDHIAGDEYLIKSSNSPLGDPQEGDAQEDKSAPLFFNAKDINPIWEQAMSSLRSFVGPTIFTQWLKPLRPITFDPETGSLIIEAPSAFARQWVIDRYIDRLTLALKAVDGTISEILINVSENGAQLAKVKKTAATAAKEMIHAGARSAHGLHNIGAPLDQEMNFDNFICNSENELAFHSALKITQSSTAFFSPLYLQSSTGQGKTHLLHAIGNRILENSPQAKICYLPAERFMVEFVSAIRRNEAIEFKNRLRGADIFMIDDIQFIMGKRSTQEEFLHLIDALTGAGKHIIIASDRAPQSLDSIEPRLLSRLGAGLVVEIEPAGKNLRKAIARHYLQSAFPNPVEECTLELLATNVNRNIRELIGALNRLIAHAQIKNCQIDMALAQGQLGTVMRSASRHITLDEIIDATCDHFRVERKDILSKRRMRAIARPRQIAMYIAKSLTPRSYPEIGRKFGGRDHSTVIHAVRQIEKLRTSHAEIDMDIDQLTRQLKK